MSSEYFSSVAPNLPFQTISNNDFPSTDQDFLSPFSPTTDSFQAPFFDEGVLDSNDSLDSRASFPDYNNVDSFIDVVSPLPSVQPPPEQEEVRRQRLARKAELARANRKRKKQVNNIANSHNYEGDSDSSLSYSGSRSPSSDCSDMYMSPGPQPVSWDGGFEEEDVRRKRLARKAELARVSRKKKKDRIEELEAQLTQMQNELTIARQLCASAAIRTEQTCNPGQPVASNFASDRLNKVMGDFANPNYLGAFYSAFIDKIREDMTQIDQLQTSMQSSLCLRFVQWIMNQNEKFYEDPSGLWYSLFSQELGASSAQLFQLLELRKEFAQKLSISGPDMVSQAFDALRKAMDDSSRLMAAFAQIFSPAQLTSFFQWVERFGPVCIKINL